MRTNGRKQTPSGNISQMFKSNCSFDTRSTSTWKFAECWLGAISESSPCEKGWISVLLQIFSLGLQVLLPSAQRIENTYSSLPAGGSCNLAFVEDTIPTFWVFSTSPFLPDRASVAFGCVFFFSEGIRPLEPWNHWPAGICPAVQSE